MKILKVPMAMVEGFAPQRLASATGRSVGEALGELIWFWASTKRGELERGTEQMLAAHMLNGDHVEALVACLLGLGLLVRDDDGLLVIEANRGIASKRLEAAERAKRARAMVGKKKVAKKKAKPEAAPAAAQGELVTQLNPGTKPGTARIQKATDHALELRREAWAAYSHAYQTSTGQLPLDNGKQRSLIMHFCRHVGADAPEVLRFYCQHPNRRYINAVYPLTMAVSDATGLHTQWKNGTYVTYEGAKSAAFDAEFLHRMNQLDQEYAQLPPEA